MGMNPFDELAGQTLTGLYLEDTCLHLRLSHQVVTIHLADGRMSKNERRHKGSCGTPWMVLPGWLRITHVTLNDILIIEVAGALYTSQIIAKRHKKSGLWQIVLRGGFAIPIMKARNL
jgi:hypothetical protein